MKIFRFLGYISFPVLLFSCSSAKRITANSPTVSGLKFINEFVVPNDLRFGGTLAGGFSGIDYDSASNVYYIISDDRSDKFPARFYKAKINIGEKGIDNVQITDVVTLLNKEGQPYPSTDADPWTAPDPESIRYDPSRNDVIWSSEGERTLSGNKKALQSPSIKRQYPDGKYKSSFYIPARLGVSEEEKGPRRNGGLEGMTLSSDHKTVVASMEEPLYQDGPRAGTGDSTAWVRIIWFNAKSGLPGQEYAYRVDAVPYTPNPPGAYKINGISEILWLSQNQLLVMERAFATGRNACGIRIYLADRSNAQDVSKQSTLYPVPKKRPLEKKLLLNMDDLGRYIDNVEGITFGPRLPNGNRSLICVSDNNFSPNQKTQFFLFEVLP